MSALAWGISALPWLLAGACPIATALWALTTCILRLCDYTIGTALNVGYLFLCTLAHSATSIFLRIPYTFSMHLFNWCRGKQAPKRRKRPTFAQWLSTVTARAPYVVRRAQDLAPTFGNPLPVPPKRFFLSADDDTTGIRCMRCGSLATHAGAKHHFCKRNCAVLANSGPVARAAALGWARSVDVVAELCRPRPLPTLDFDGDLMVEQATAMALASISRILMNDIHDMAGWNMLSLFHTLVFTPASMDMYRDPSAYRLHIASNCERVFTGDWSALLADANSAGAGLGGQRRSQRSGGPAAAPRSDSKPAYRTMRLVCEGKLGRAMDMPRDAFHPAVLPGGEEILGGMRAKHPPSKEPFPPLPADTPRFTLSFEAFMGSVHALKDGKSPGADGLSDGMLRRALLSNTPDGQFLLDAIYLIASAVTAGRISKQAGSLIMLCELVGLPKPVAAGAPPDSRPIGLNASLRKLCFGAYLEQKQDVIPLIYAPFQHCAAAGGVDLAILTSRRAAAFMPNSLDACLDIYNAWNEPGRAFIFRCLLCSRLADAAPMYSTTYGQPIQLIFKHPDLDGGFAIIWSYEGATQGCKLAQLFFCILMAPICVDLFGPGAIFQRVILCILFADDAKLRCISPERQLHFGQLTQCIAAFEERLNAVGLRFVAPKSFAALLIDDPRAQVCPIPARGTMSDQEWRRCWPHVDGKPLALKTDGYKYLGSPFASHTPAGSRYLVSFYGDHVRSMVGEMNMVQSALVEHPNAQLSLLSACIVTRFTHLLRYSEPSPELIAAVCEIDRATLSFFFTTSVAPGAPVDACLSQLPASLANAIRAQMFLPLDMTGFGVHSLLAMLAPAAISVLRSYRVPSDAHLQAHGIISRNGLDYTTRAYSRLRALLAALQSAFTPTLPLTLADVCGDTQAELQLDFNKALLEKLLDSLRRDNSVMYEGFSEGRQHAARLISQTFQVTRSSFAWITTTGELSAAEWRTVCAARLGLAPDIGGGLPLRRICGGVVSCRAILDRPMYHLFSCITKARQDLHHYLCLWLAHTCAESGAFAEVDYERLGVVRGNRTRPGDVILFGLMRWLSSHNGRDIRVLIADLKVVHPAVKSYAGAGRGDTCGGVATRMGADAKHNSFKAKIGNDPSLVQFASPWVFRAWVISVYGDMNSEMTEDLTGIARMIAVKKLRGKFDERTIERAAAAELKRLTTALSCELQRQLYTFFDHRLHECN